MKIVVGIWGEREKRTIKILKNAGIMAATMMTCESAFAYTPGTIAAKAEPVVNMIRELADPIAYGALTWACIRLTLNQKAEAKEMMRSVAWGYSFIQLSPTAMEIIKSIGR